MMEQQRCPGCGVVMQSEQPEEIGYSPAAVHSSPKAVRLCQRCYRIVHYGRDGEQSVSIDAINTVTKALAQVDGVVLVVDIWDFPATATPEILQLFAHTKLIVALNKIDLLPRRTSIQEMKAWAQSRLIALGADPVAVVPTSGLDGDYIKSLLRQMRRFGKQWLFAGSTNAGKSTIIAKMSAGTQRAGLPTVSKYPGTTVALLPLQMKEGLTAIDSPGLQLPGRLSDLACRSCQTDLVPGQPVQAQVHKVGNALGLTLPGYAVATCSGSTSVVIGLSASKVGWERIRPNRRNILSRLQRDCACSFVRWHEYILQVEANWDLVIWGGAWLSARRSSVKVELLLPEEVQFSLQPALVGPKQER